MKIAYHADNAIDAQLISDLLNNNDIFAQVRGANMQGAVGEAPAMGNVKVWVHDEDLHQAQFLVEEWDQASFVDEEEAELFGDEQADDGSPKGKAPWSAYTKVMFCIFIGFLLMVFGRLIAKL